METPALHRYGRMPMRAQQTTTAVAPNSPAAALPLRAPRVRRDTVRTVIGAAAATTLTVLLAIGSGTMFPGLLHNGGVLLGFLGTAFAGSVVVGYVLSGFIVARVTRADPI
jgi:hypothetical protein